MKRFLIISILITLTALPYAAAVTVYHLNLSLIQQKLEYSVPLPGELYDRRGELVTRFYDEFRLPSAQDEIPPHLVDAFITAEDRNFFTHTGLNFEGIIRAAVTNIREGSIKQGGSSITQQLVKQLYTGKQRTFQRKILEVFLVKRVEEEYSKNEIMTMYLNQIYFGHGIYGVKSATSFFFGKELSQITPVEAALLAIIPPAPNANSPLKNPRIAYAKHLTLVRNMVMEGFIAKERAGNDFNAFWNSYSEQLLMRAPTEVAASRRTDRAPYFSEYIRELLIKEYGEDKLYRGGMKIYSTIDVDMQQIAQQALCRKIAEQEKYAARHNAGAVRNAERRALGDDKETRIKSEFIKEFTGVLEESNMLFMLTAEAQLADSSGEMADFFDSLTKSSRVEGAFVAMEPDTGCVRVLVGGSGFTGANQLNRAISARRQPGSAFKPFVYSAGIEIKKITAATEFQDLPMVFRGTRRIWEPVNADKRFTGTVLTRQAIARSINTVAVAAYEEIGGAAIVECAAKMIGVDEKRFDDNPTLPLGTSELTPLEMATGFSTIANRGYRVDPCFIEKIVDNEGKEIYTHKKEAVRAVSEATAFIMTDLLRSVVEQGTATGAVRIRGGFAEPCAGKTGTNSDYRDAWYAGFTPDMTAIVWVGCDSQEFTLGPSQYGASVAAPVWAEFMRTSAQLRSKKSFPAMPDAVVSARVCRHSGRIAGSSCPTINEYFIKGTQPGSHCSGVHQYMQSIFSLTDDNPPEAQNQDDAE